MKAEAKPTVLQKIGMFFYTRRAFTLFIWITVVVLGIMSYTTWMRREGFPAVNVPIGVVRVVSVNQPASVVDTEFAQPILAEIESLESVKSVSTTSSDQGSSLVITFSNGTDVQAELDKLKSQVGANVPNASSQTFYIKVEAGKLTEEGDDILISVHKAGLTPAELDAAADKLVPIIEQKSTLSESARTMRLVEQIDTPAGPVESQVRFDRFYSAETGQVEPSSTVAVKGVAGVDQLKLYDEITQLLAGDSVKSIGATSTVSADFAESVTEQISGLQKNLLEGLIVVLVVSFILISLRGSIITALAMTTTVLATVGVLYGIGYTLNTITLFSLVLCLALIVDDTTIMVEAIDAGLKRGGKFKDVVKESFRKVAHASATGTFVTILAFAPMLFIGGILGEFIRAIPVTIIISLLISLIVSFIFIPLMMRLTYGKLKDGKADVRIRPMDKVERAIGNSIAGVILWSAVNRKRKAITRFGAVMASLAIVMMGGYIFTKVEFNIFPSPKDGNEIYVQGRIIDRENATIGNTEKITDEVLAVVQSELGANMERLTLSGQGGVADRDGFFATVKLVPYGKRDVTSVELAERLQEKLASTTAEMRLSTESAGVGPPSGSFTVQIAASDPDAAYALAEDLRTFLASTEITRIDGTTAQLKDVTLTPQTLIVRDGSARVVSVSAGFSDKDTSTLVALAQTAVEEKFNEAVLSSYNLPSDALTFDFGQEDENQDSFSSMGKAALPLFFAMFVLMAILFRSLLQPILIFTALPFAFVGVALGLYLTDNPISFFSMLGVFALIGISLNNTILLTDYANQARAQGKNPTESIASAIRERLRPLLTTSITSILALLPLALNDPFWEGLAFALMFGLLSSTILVIILFPYFYLIEATIANWFRKLYKLARKQTA